MPTIGPSELILILVVVLIFFGVGRLPEAGSAMGKAIREFRKATTEDEALVQREEDKTKASRPE